MQVTHPFHPFAGQHFEFVKRRKSWRADLVYLYDGADELRCLPAEWTDVVAPDPFVTVAAGRCPFHITALLELADLLAELAGRRADVVKETMP